MNIFRKAIGFFTRDLSIQDPKGWTDGQRSHSGEAVTQDAVLALSAAFACVNLLAGTIASLPISVYRPGTGGAKVEDKTHWLYRLLHDSPNADQTAIDFWESICVAIELRGNGFAYKEMLGDRMVALVPVRPDIMFVARGKDGRLEYRWTDRGERFVKKPEEMLHVRGFGGGPEGGMSTLSFGRQAFGLSIAIDKAAGSTFRHGLRPSVVLKFEKWLTPEQRTITEERMAEGFAGAINAGKPLVLEGGIGYDQLKISPEDAQMLESRGFSVEEICRFFGVPPHMVGHTANSTSWGTGLEQQTLGFQKFTLRRRLTRIEQAIKKQLLTDKDRAEGVTVEFNLEGLLRGDSAARAKFYQIMTQIGAMTINDVRRLENLPPIDGGDVPRIQTQNQPITDAPGIGLNSGDPLGEGE